MAVHDMAQAVLACVCAALEETASEVDGQPGCPPCRSCVVPGTPAWDSCADPCSGEAGGQLTVNVARLYPSSEFPTQSNDVQGIRNCGPPATAVELVVTLLRCVPTADGNGCPPSCDEQAAAAQVVHVDAVTIMNALYCCLPSIGPARRGPKFVVGAQRIIGPEGGCVGVEQRVTIALPGCSCPEEGVNP
jgi:hypothetical protein